MPSLESVEVFVQLVEGSQTVEAMVRFYGEDASMQENNAPPRVGKNELIKHEEKALASIASLQAKCIRPIFISENFVVLRWHFEIQDKMAKQCDLKKLRTSAGKRTKLLKKDSSMTQPSSNKAWACQNMVAQAAAVLPNHSLNRTHCGMRQKALHFILGL